MMEPALLSASLLVLLIPALYLYAVDVVSARFAPLRGKRICLLIAHPDDEAMFFAPTVLALARPELGNHVKILCLSSGDAEGLGHTRKEELVKSGLVLGLRKPEDVYVVDNPADFPDSMTATWPAEAIASLLRDAFAPRRPAAAAASKPGQQPPAATIDVLITFDARGVSSHPNHISLYHGARAFVASLAAGRPGRSSPVDLYTLTTVSVSRKYAGVLDVLPTLAATARDAWRAAAGTGRGAPPASAENRPAALVFMHGLGRGGWLTAREAMTSAHRSQMAWFRYGWITLSRYMFMNDLRLEKA